MFSPLLESIIEREKMPVVDEEALGKLCAQHELVALMVTGDYTRVSTSNDLAVILPELVKAYGGLFTPCVSERESEGNFQAKCGFVLLPSLVFFHKSQQIGVISGIFDWTEFIQKINEILPGTHRMTAAQ